MTSEALAVAEPKDTSQEAPEAKTSTVRVMADLLTKIKVIEAAKSAQGKRFKVIEFLDSILRDPITAEYEKALAAIRKMK